MFGSNAAVASVAAAGFADAHSGSISAALLERNEVLPTRTAQVAILLSFSTNAVTKVVVSGVSGPRDYFWRIAIGVAASVSAAWAAWTLTLG